MVKSSSEKDLNYHPSVTRINEMHHDAEAEEVILEPTQQTTPKFSARINLSRRKRPQVMTAS